MTPNGIDFFLVLTCCKCGAPTGNRHQLEPVPEPAAPLSPLLPSLQPLPEPGPGEPCCQLLGLPLASPEACCIAPKGLQACPSQHLPVSAPTLHL